MIVPTDDRLNFMWFWLGCAIVAEVTGTMSLRFSEGFSRIGPSVLVLAGYGIAFIALSKALTRGMPVGVAYGIWSAAGITIIACIGALFLAEPLTRMQIMGIVLIVGGVLILELGRAPG